MSQTIKNMVEARKWQSKFNPGAPKPGEIAPDFELWDVHNEKRVKLSEFRGVKPVALIFGSFT